MHIDNHDHRDAVNSPAISCMDIVQPTKSVYAKFQLYVVEARCVLQYAWDDISKEEALVARLSAGMIRCAEVNLTGQFVPLPG